MKNLADKRRAEKKEEEEARCVVAFLAFETLCWGRWPVTAASTMKKEGWFGEDYTRLRIYDKSPRGIQHQSHQKAFTDLGPFQHNPGNLLAGLGHVQGIHPGYHRAIVPMGVSSWGTRATTIRSSSGRQFPQFLQVITWKHQIYTWQDLESQILTPQENSFKEMTFLCRSGFDLFFQENGQFTQVHQVGQWSFLVFLRVERFFIRKSVLTNDVHRSYFQEDVGDSQ